MLDTVIMKYVFQVGRLITCKLRLLIPPGEGFRGLADTERGSRWWCGEEVDVGGGVLGRVPGVFLLGEDCGCADGWMRELSSQGERGSRLNQCPLRSLRTLSSWSLARSWACASGCRMCAGMPSCRGGGIVCSVLGLLASVSLEVVGEWAGDDADVVSIATVAGQPLWVWQSPLAPTGVRGSSWHWGLCEGRSSGGWGSMVTTLVSCSSFSGEERISLFPSWSGSMGLSSSCFTSFTPPCISSCWWCCRTSSLGSSLTCTGKFLNLSRCFSSTSTPKWETEGKLN